MNTSDSTKHLLISILLILFFVPAATLSAQHFEGEITYEFTDVTDGSTDTLNMLVAENRLVLRGNVRQYVDFPLFRDTITIRTDRNDLLIHTETAVAAVNLGELSTILRQFMNNSGNAQQPQTADTDRLAERTYLTETTETRRIHGMRARKFILHDREIENRETHLWLADADINWGALLQPVNDLLSTFGGGTSLSSVPWELSMTPLLAEDYVGGELRAKVEATQFQSRRLSADEKDIPEGKQQISLFQLMMMQN
ncbi:MAG: hypothetical protein LAT75_01805 [Candidatus Cyclonatronum sp.]|uniref:hypothetical protein n=1 Tax=Cyclonatronum sp. TaxID=3024185 RepID=UPI0025C31882|nr:hypothetical protein [Cyclonatronum sp.]MCH8485567.1 hypothetical protein [Cyclonatronum sp.]